MRAAPCGVARGVGMARRMGGWALLAAGLMVAGCGDKTSAAAARKLDQSPVAGADPAYSAKGWKAGDNTAWQEHMRARAQAQNEYNKTH